MLRRSLVERSADLGETVSLRLEYLDDAELLRLLADADVLVYPFRRITTSGSVMLGLAAGRPVVVPDLPAFRDLPAEATYRYSPVPWGFAKPSSMRPPPVPDDAARERRGGPCRGEIAVMGGDRAEDHGRDGAVVQRRWVRPVTAGCNRREGGHRPRMGDVGAVVGANRIPAATERLAIGRENEWPVLELRCEAVTVEVRLEGDIVVGDDARQSAGPSCASSPPKPKRARSDAPLRNAERLVVPARESDDGFESVGLVVDVLPAVRVAVRAPRRRRRRRR